MKLKNNMEISPVVYNAVELMKNSFGGTDVKIFSEKKYRTQPNEYSPIGVLGVDIYIQDIIVFLSYSISENISVYGQYLADSFVFDILKDEYKRMIRREKYKKFTQI
jgi:hypothetical protein